MIKQFIPLLIILSTLLPFSLNATTLTKDLLKQSETALEAGEIYNALELLKNAEQQDNNEQDWLISIAISDALLLNGQIKAADKKLQNIYQAVKTAEKLSLLCDIMLRFGHISTARNSTYQAQKWYRKALTTAQQTADHALIATALINLSTVKQDPLLLQQAVEHIDSLTDLVIQQKLLLSLAYQASQQGQIQLAQQGLQAVIDKPVTSRIKSQALGYMAELYTRQTRIDEALQLTRLAMLADNSTDLQLQWSWQRARLLSKQQKNTQALAAYRNAIQQLQQLRIDIPVVYQNGQSSFTQTYEPLFTGFIEALLRQAETKINDQQQKLLAEAIQTWEQLKTVEMQDYFRDACVVKQQQKKINIENHTAMLYPIILQDQLALLVRFSNQIKAYSVNTTSAQIKEVIAQINDALNSKEPLQKQSQMLYQWLIAPIIADLQQHSVQTLVYLPDGVLRKIPFALLHDGKHYLTEKYQLVTVPSLTMLATPSENVRKDDILLAGLSEPGPVVDELLNGKVNLFDSPESDRSVIEQEQQRGLILRQGWGGNNNARTLRANRMKELLALPGVNEELNALSAISQVPVMKNTDFLLEKFEASVQQGHSIVHIASHGFFSGTPEKSFIMTYDHLLNMNQLAQLFQTEAFHNRPIELVTLSACQTAEGDDRSPLGLSGVVVQAGVKSAIGTLWPVADEAAKQFFSDFYQFYQQAGATKSSAMQQAQQKLMTSSKQKHPAYWAPFILVGEWH